LARDDRGLEVLHGMCWRFAEQTAITSPYLKSRLSFRMKRSAMRNLNGAEQILREQSVIPN
jgi:hypothetical protein